MTPPCLRWTKCDDIRAMHRALVRVVNGAAVLRGLRTIVHAVVADYAGNAQPIVLKDFRPALGLVLAMLRHIAPCRKRLFIAEKRQRQDLALLGQALEAFDRDKSVDGFQNGPQLGRQIEILLPVLRLRPDFEDHGYHLHSPFLRSR